MSDVVEPVRLLIGGSYHEQWESYRIDSDIRCPADDWDMMAFFPAQKGVAKPLPDFLYEGAQVQVRMGDELILDGQLDDIDDDLDKTSHVFQLYGRDRGALLVDCAAPLVSLQMATLEQIVKQAVSLVGIKAVKYAAKPAAPRQKVHTEPGQTIWEWLMQACEANQVWPWFDPDGTLVIGQPDYEAPTVANLVMRFNGDGNNAKKIRRSRSIRESFSEVTVLGQSSGDGDVGHHDIKGVATDPTVPMYRPHVVIDGNCENVELATHRANKILADGRMTRDRIMAVVKGHRIVGGDGDGKLWTPGMRVNILSEPQGINGVYFLLKRTFILSRQDRSTELHFVPDRTWMLNVPFIKAKRRSSYGTRKGHYASDTGSDDGTN
jgi:prophage tail gpP-like protein